MSASGGLVVQQLVVGQAASDACTCAVNQQDPDWHAIRPGTAAIVISERKLSASLRRRSMVVLQETAQTLTASDDVVLA